MNLVMLYNYRMLDLSRYKELYHYDDKRSLVINEVTGDVRMMKKLSHYEESVYEYLAANSNDHIPEITGYTKDNDGNLIIIEEVIEGNTFDVVINDRSMPDKEKLKYFLGLLEGLEHLHKAATPVIHRDLKPSNIMVTDKGEVKIIDYDSAKIYKPGQNGDTTNLGTDGIAAPEQYGFMQSDPRSDIYAVGKMLADAFPDNKKIQRIAAKASSFDPADRYESVRELADALEGRISPDLKLKPLFPPPGFRTRKWWKIALALLIYPFALYMIISVTVENGSVADNIEGKIFAFFYFIVPLDIYTSWTGIYDILPFVKDKNLILQYLFKTIFAALAVFIMIVMFLFFNALRRSFIP